MLATNLTKLAKNLNKKTQLFLVLQNPIERFHFVYDMIVNQLLKRHAGRKSLRGVLCLLEGRKFYLSILSCQVSTFSKFLEHNLFGESDSRLSLAQRTALLGWNGNGGSSYFYSLHTRLSEQTNTIARKAAMKMNSWQLKFLAGHA